MPYASVTEIRAANRAAGGHFFDRDTMRTFRTRVELRGKVIGGRYFLTSDVLNENDGPVYSVRVASDSGDVRTAGNFAQHSGYRTLAEAERIARALAGADERDAASGAHVDYPHHPGYLFDCPACESSCHCSAGNAECVFEGEHNGTAAR